MPPVLRRRFGWLATAVVALFVTSLLLNGGAPIPLGATSHVQPTPQGAVSAGVRASEATHTSVHATAAPRPIGHVVMSPLLDYNTTVDGNFGSSVWDWGVGPGTVVPSTGMVWLSDNLTPVYRGAAPPEAPAVLYDPNSNSFVGTVPELPNTSTLLYDSTNGWIYSTDPLNNTVGVFDPGNLTWLKTIPVGTDPSALSLDPANNTLYVANSGSNNLTLINTTTGLDESTSIAVGHTPVGLAFDAAHSQLFIASSGSAQLDVVDTITNTIATTVPLVGDAGGVAVSEVAGTVAVTVPSVGKLTVAYTSNLAVLTAALAVGFGSHAVVTSPDGAEFVVAVTSRAHIVSVNASDATVLFASIPVGADPLSLTSDGGNGLVYSWSPTFRNLTPVDTSTGLPSPASPTLGVRPVATAYDPTTSRVFVADQLTHSILVLDATSFASVAPPITLSARPNALVDDPTSSNVYIGLNGSIQILDAVTAQLTGVNVSLAGVNGGLLVDDADGLLWVMNNVSGLLAFHLGTLAPALTTTIVPDAAGFASLAIDASTDQLFALTAGGSGTEVAVIDASTGITVAAGIAAGVNLTALVFDPADNQVYVLGNNLTMVNATTLAVDSQTVYLPTHVMAGGSLLYEPSRQFLYATTPGGLGTVGELTIIDGSSTEASSTASGTLYTGYAPTALLAVNYPGATDSGSGVVVAANLNSGSLAVIATSPAEIDFLTASPDLIDLGQSTHILVQYIGGAGNVVVSYSGLPVGCVSLDTLDLGCTPSVSGTFTVAVTLIDSLGGVDFGTTSLTVAPGLNLSANFTAATFPQLDPGSSFTAIASVFGGTRAYTFFWNFGDGTRLMGSSAKHAYATPGEYALTLMVRDNLGETGTAAWSVLVNPLPTLGIVSVTDLYDVNHSASFAATIVGGTGSGPTNWTFGDGATGAGLSVSHAWSRAGTYLVNASYVDADGQVATASESITVNPALVGTFSAAAPATSRPVPGTNMTFTATVAQGSAPYTIQWNFGDGSTAVGEPVTHTYASAGNYTVKVLVTDSSGATLNGSFVVGISAASTTPSSTSSSPLNFPLGLFLGILVGAALAAVVVYAVGPRRRKAAPPAKPPASPYVPPAGAPVAPEWKED
jgi:YVTN family beta-propeller protein